MLAEHPWCESSLPSHPISARLDWNLVNVEAIWIHWTHDLSFVMWCVLSRRLWQERNVRETNGCHIQIYILETAFFSLREFGEQLVSWNCFFAETQEADCWEPKSRAEEISGMCAIINAVAVRQPGEAQREFYTAWLVVVVPAWFFFLFLCRSEMRLYTISGTMPRQLHTPVPKWCGVKGSTPVLSFFLCVFYSLHGNLKSQVERLFTHRDQ